MNDNERNHIIKLLQNGEALSREWIPVLFPAEKQECELAYAGKAREADILAETMAVPLQCTRCFAKLADAGFDPVFGARPLKRAIQTELENPLARRILESDFPPGNAIKVDSADGEFVFS